MNPTDRIRTAIDTTRKIAPGYFERCLAQRIDGPNQAGSTYGQITPEHLEGLLRTATWEPYAHPDIVPGCHGFTAHIAGQIGIVELARLNPGTFVTIADPKGTGACDVTIAGVHGEHVWFTVAILGIESGAEVLFTFHPGAPIVPSNVTALTCGGARQITVAEAMRYGFTHAKIVNAL